MAWFPSSLYSQNYEDLYLWRLFRDKHQGFYIDVGAYHPATDSVTKIFYDQGWCGINIEPVPALFKAFQRDRSRDTNLPIALSGENGFTTINIVGDSGLSSVDSYSSSIAPEAFSQRSLEVPVRTLYSVICTHAPSSIDFIKIDVEGFELEVLRGLELNRLHESLRPKVILLEVTLPNSRIDSPVRDDCQFLLEESGYQKFFFDGLNDYYCQDSELFRCSSAVLPPNVFDKLPVTPGYYQSMLSELDEAKHQLQDAFKEIKLMRNELDSLREEKPILAKQVCDFKHELHQLHSQKLILSDMIMRHESKLLWLRSRRNASDKMIKSLMFKLIRVSHLIARLRLHADRLM